MSRSNLRVDAAMQRVVRVLAIMWSALVRGARLAVGVPDYNAYVEHMRRRHPNTEPMDREAFFRERMEARYGRGRGRCC